MADKPQHRRVRKVGGSLTLTIPKDMGMEEGDYVSFAPVKGVKAVIVSVVEP